MIEYSPQEYMPIALMVLNAQHATIRKAVQTAIGWARGFHSHIIGRTDEALKWKVSDQ